MVHEYLNPTWSFFITSLISLFIVIDPPGNLFAFLALSAGYSPPASRELAWRSCLFSFIILTVFVLIGRFIIHFFGISLAAFQIAGGLILFRIAFDMLEGRGHFNRLDTSSSLVADDYRDVALVPLAVPLLAGPGAITAVLVLSSRSPGHLQDGLIVLAEAIILFLSYLGFLFAEKLLALLRESSIRLLTRIMGLILAALAVEFVIQGLRAAFPYLHQ